MLANNSSSVGNLNYVILNNSLGVLAFKCVACDGTFITQHYLHNNRIHCKACYLSTQATVQQAVEEINQIQTCQYIQEEPMVIQEYSAYKDEIDPLTKNLQPKYEPEDNTLFEIKTETFSSGTFEAPLEECNLPLLNNRDGAQLQLECDPLCIKSESNCLENHDSNTNSTECPMAIAVSVLKSSASLNHGKISAKVTVLSHEAENQFKKKQALQKSTTRNTNNSESHATTCTAITDEDDNICETNRASVDSNSSTSKQDSLLEKNQLTTKQNLTDELFSNTILLEESANNDISSNTFHVAPKPNNKTFFYKCKLCIFSTSLPAEYNQHIVKKHAELRQDLIIPIVHKCDNCPYYATTKEGLNSHMLSKHNNGNDLKYKSALERFMSFNRKFKCLHCKFSARDKEALETHIKHHSRSTLLIYVENDGNMSVYRCNLCGRRYTCRRYILRHVRNHIGEKRYCCYICGKCFTHSTHMKEHINKHVNSSNYVCNVCSYNTFSKNNFDRHMILHSDMKFKCSICSFEAVRKESYKTHMRKHTGEKPFRCKHCSYQGASHMSLYLHSKRHSENSLFTCLQCNYTTYHKYNFKSHTSRHTGDGLMTCAKCDYSTTHRPNFIQHVNRGCSKAKIRFKK